MRTETVARLKILGVLLPVSALLAAVVVLLGSSLGGTPAVNALHPEIGFDRIVVDVGKPDQNLKVAAAKFRCQFASNAILTELKAHLKDQNPNDPPNIDHEVWSGTFADKCIGEHGGVEIFLTPVDPNNSLLIKECRFENTVTGASATCLIKGDNPGVPPGEQHFKAVLAEPPPPAVGGIAVYPDADSAAPLETSDSSSGNTGLLVGIAAAVATGVVALGGAAWYARRRKLA